MQLKAFDAGVAAHASHYERETLRAKQIHGKGSPVKAKLRCRTHATSSFKPLRYPKCVVSRCLSPPLMRFALL
jgi:hypothetical protein